MSTAPTTTENAPENTAAERVRTLTVHDRCDTCGAGAYYRAVVNGSDLYYCAHHATKYEAKLSQAASEILDERSFLHG